MSNRHNITDEQWNRIKDLLPPEHSGKKGRPCKDNRNMVNAMIWIARTGAPWRDLPKEFGSWKSVYTRFSRWNQRGIWQQVLKGFTADADEESIMIDSTIIRAHQHAAGAKGGSNFRN